MGVLYHKSALPLPLLRDRTTGADKSRKSFPCVAPKGYAFGESSLQGGIRRCASTVGIRSAWARPTPRPWHAPKKLCFKGKPRAKRSARRGLKTPRSCAPNAMPPFAPPCRHFALLVRSIASQSARVPSETLAFLRRIWRPSKAHPSLRPQIHPFPRTSFLHPLIHFSFRAFNLKP